MINDSFSNYNLNFSGRPKLKKILPQIKQAFNTTLPDIESPTRIDTFLPLGQRIIQDAEIKELDQKIRFVRHFIESLIPDEGLAGYFRGQIGIVKAFKVANCGEYAEITKSILKINGIKNCDMFGVFAKKANSKDAPRSLDHAIVAFNVKKSHNNKKTAEPFIPRPGIRIIDMWYNGYIGTIKGAHKKFRNIGLMPGETIMLKPLKTYEPNNEAFEAIRRDFPRVLIKTKNN